MKLHEIKKGSELYVAKLSDDINMINIDNNKLLKLKFKRMITNKVTAHFAEWCKELPKVKRDSFKSKINCINPSMFSSNVGNIAVFSENSKGEMFLALVKEKDINFYVNI